MHGLLKATMHLLNASYCKNEAALLVSTQRRKGLIAGM